ncbi:hypothetical protein KJ975_04175 [Myxococcota bacterium]|nr:hypothetical protein [Myxococcota bacterium]
MRYFLLFLLVFTCACGENLRGQYNDPPGRLRTPKMADKDLSLDELNTLITESNILLAEAHQSQYKAKPWVCIPEKEWKIRTSTSRHLEKEEKSYQWVALGPQRSESEAYGGELKAEFDHIFTDIEKTIEKTNAIYSRAMEVTARVKREPSRKILHQISFSLGIATVLSMRPMLAALELAQRSPQRCSWKPFAEHIRWMKSLMETMNKDYLTPELQAMRQMGFQKSEMFVYQLMFDIALKTGAAEEKCTKLETVDKAFRPTAHLWCGFMDIERNQPDLAREHFEDAKEGAQGAAAAYIEDQLSFLNRKSPALRVKKVN